MNRFEILFWCALAIAGWYVASETLSWIWCKVMGITPDQYESDQVWELRAGMFMMPVLVAMLLAELLFRWMGRQLTRLAQYVGLPIDLEER
jgi:hypothetical protein